MDIPTAIAEKVRVQKLDTAFRNLSEWRSGSCDIRNWTKPKVMMQYGSLYLSPSGLYVIYRACSQCAITFSCKKPAYEQLHSPGICISADQSQLLADKHALHLVYFLHREFRALTNKQKIEAERDKSRSQSCIQH